MLIRFILAGVALLTLSAHSATVTPVGNGTAIIDAESASGNLVTIEALDDLARNNWEIISTVIARTNAVKWADPWCGTASNRFYRIKQAKFSELPPNRAQNFRL